MLGRLFASSWLTMQSFPIAPAFPSQTQGHVEQRAAAVSSHYGHLPCILPACPRGLLDPHGPAEEPYSRPLAIPPCFYSSFPCAAIALLQPQIWERRLGIDRAAAPPPPLPPPSPVLHLRPAPPSPPPLSSVITAADHRHAGPLLPAYLSLFFLIHLSSSSAPLAPPHPPTAATPAKKKTRPPHPHRTATLIPSHTWPPPPSSIVSFPSDKSNKPPPSFPPPPPPPPPPLQLLPSLTTQTRTRSSSSSSSGDWVPH